MLQLISFHFWLKLHLYKNAWDILKIKYLPLLTLYVVGRFFPLIKIDYCNKNVIYTGINASMNHSSIVFIVYFSRKTAIIDSMIINVVRGVHLLRLSDTFILNVFCLFFRLTFEK